MPKQYLVVPAANVNAQDQLTSLSGARVDDDGIVASENGVPVRGFVLTRPSEVLTPASSAVSGAVLTHTAGLWTQRVNDGTSSTYSGVINGAGTFYVVVTYIGSNVSLSLSGAGITAVRQRRVVPSSAFGVEVFRVTATGAADLVVANDGSSDMFTGWLYGFSAEGSAASPVDAAAISPVIFDSNYVSLSAPERDATISTQNAGSALLCITMMWGNNVENQGTDIEFSGAFSQADETTVAQIPSQHGSGVAVLNEVSAGTYVGGGEFNDQDGSNGSAYTAFIMEVEAA